jgi:hypothetical protein
MAGTDVLEQSARPPRLTRRARLGVVALAAVLALVAGGADWQARRQENAGIDRCARAALRSVAVAEGRVSMMTRYVAPALASSPPAGLRRGLLDMVSEAARPTTPGMRRARDLCQSVRVLPTHAEGRRTRTDCLRLLDAELSYLSAVAKDGEHTFEASGSTPQRCVER